MRGRKFSKYKSTSYRDVSALQSLDRVHRRDRTRSKRHLFWQAHSLDKAQPETTSPIYDDLVLDSGCILYYLVKKRLYFETGLILRQTSHMKLALSYAAYD